MSKLSLQAYINNKNPKSVRFDSDLDSNHFHIKKFGDRIQPISFIYQKIEHQGDLKNICKISVKGYKNVSRVVASGEQTICILNKITKTSCIKLIRSIEFDPYFCDTSGLKALSEVLTKLRRLLKGLTLTLRRVKTNDEVKKFSSFLARVSDLKLIKIEIPSSSGVNAKDFECIAGSFKRFIFLKDAEALLGGFKGIGESLSKARDIISSSKHLERTRSQIYFPYQKPSLTESSQQQRPPQQILKKRKVEFAKHLKSVSLKFASDAGWSSYFDGADITQGLHIYLQNYPKIANPIHFSLTFFKMRISFEVLTALVNMLPHLTNLRFLDIEFNSFKITQYEMLTLAKGFTDCKQIEHLTFKYLDKAPSPMEDLIHFITILAKFSRFPKFDLFFRKLFYPEWQTLENRKRLDELANIKYVLTRQSIHIQKVLPVEGGNSFDSS